jgi:acyl-CoA thioesterase FadM
VPRYRLPVTHRPERDGTVLTFAHVPYYLALEVASPAWARMLDELGQGLLSAADVAVVRADFHFRRELFTGSVDVDVDVTRIGRTSLTFAVAMYQRDVLALKGETVVARTDEGRDGAVPLSPVQRAMLESLVAA